VRRRRGRIRRPRPAPWASAQRWACATKPAIRANRGSWRSSRDARAACGAGLATGGPSVLAAPMCIAILTVAPGRGARLHCQKVSVAPPRGSWARPVARCRVRRKGAARRTAARTAARSPICGRARVDPDFPFPGRRACSRPARHPPGKLTWAAARLGEGGVRASKRARRRRSDDGTPQQTSPIRRSGSSTSGGREF
jgi:hypothetical protein